MLRRQQAEVVIAAREKIVQGAVSMVDMALAELSAKNVVDLDDERKAAMVSNLMVVALRRVRRAARAEHGNAVPVGRNAAARRHAPCRSFGGKLWRSENSIPCASIRRCAGIERQAADDLRSVNAQVEFILRRALKDAGRLKDEGGRQPGHPGRTGDEEAPAE